MEGRSFTIVGVAADVPYSRLGETPREMVYVPFGAPFKSWVTLLVRTSGPPAAALPALRGAFHELDPALRPHALRTLAQLRDAALLPARSLGVVAGAFGAVALCLAACGLFGLVAYAVQKRRREIGVRLALGAGGSQVARLVLGGALRPVAAGAGLGSAAGVAAGRALSSLLFGVGPLEISAHLGAIGVLFAVALLAAAAPTLAALRVDPAEVLRAE
jgi:predicted lysophospholipase L1 biosynthesis ABC-type transport system permease subunit